MQVNLGLIINDSKVLIYSLNGENQTIADKKIDIVSLPDENIHCLYYPNEVIEQATIASIIEKESKYLPAYTYESLGVDPIQIENWDFTAWKSLYLKSISRSVLTNNISHIESAYSSIKYLRDLYIKDRNNFFEELWFTLKQNLGTQSLTIIFHDLKEPTEKQAEKGEKPKLCYSYVEGTKLPNLMPGKDKEALIMTEYDKEFTNTFNITEYNEAKGEFIACAKIGLSPVLMMAKLPQFNPVQKAVLEGIFSGLQEEN